MATPDDQLRRARDRDYGVRGGYDRLQSPPAAGPAFTPCLTVDTGAYPTDPGKYVSVRPIRQTGAVGEGLPVSYDTGAAAFLAAHVGTRMPDPGAVVMVFQCGGRNVFPYY